MVDAPVVLKYFFQTHLNTKVASPVLHHIKLQNKALSKYYRETTKPKKEITFSIRESTRGSKRSVYTYNGRREKLKSPVEYSIKDGRTIVKHYKNRLIKVKKSELSSETTVPATPAVATATASA